MALKTKILGREALTKRLNEIAPSIEKYAAPVNWSSPKKRPTRSQREPRQVQRSTTCIVSRPVCLPTTQTRSQSASILRRILQQLAFLLFFHVEMARVRHCSA